MSLEPSSTNESLLPITGKLRCLADRTTVEKLVTRKVCRYMSILIPLVD